MQKKIILTGGGTAGHVWPHFALFEGEASPLAQAFKRNELQVHYVGSQTGMEKDLVRSTQPTWVYHSILTGKLRRYFSVQNFIDPFKIVAGFLQAFLLVRKIKPSVVFSKGGFVSAPVVWAAWLCRVPVVIHESDATPALATRLTLPFARRALLAFAETIVKLSPRFRQKAHTSGLPIRESLFQATRAEALTYFHLDSKRKTILVFGGSLGAQSLNQKIFELVPSLVERYNVIHITGKGNQRDLGVSSAHYKQFEFLRDDMKFAYAAADLAICRAGASSIFELAAGRIPMLLLPLGLHASRGDQIINAQIFAGKGWAQWIPESEFQGHPALSLIDSAMSSLKEKQEALSSAPTKFAASEVSQILWDEMLRYEVRMAR